MSAGTITIPRCPHCLSLRIHQEVRPCIGMEAEGDITYMLNGSVMRCDSCGHAWDRKASRGIGLKNYPTVRQPMPAAQPGP